MPATDVASQFDTVTVSEATPEAVQGMLDTVSGRGSAAAVAHVSREIGQHFKGLGVCAGRPGFCRFPAEGGILWIIRKDNFPVPPRGHIYIIDEQARWHKFNIDI